MSSHSACAASTHPRADAGAAGSAVASHRASAPPGPFGAASSCRTSSEPVNLVVVDSCGVRAVRVEEPALGGVLTQSVGPPAAADDVQHQAGPARAQGGDHVEGVLDVLVRHQPGQHDQPRGVGVGVRAGALVRGRLARLDVRRERVESVAHHGDARGVHAEPGELVGRGERHGHVLTARVHARGQPRLDPPADPRDQPPGHRPLLTVDVVDQHHHGRGGGQAGEEGDAVLGVDDDVGPP